MAKAKIEVPFVDLKIQYRTLKKELDRKILKALGDCHFILGPGVSKFEKEFAQFCNARFAVSTSSGTSAIFLALKALGIGKGDEVLTQANTFIATVLAIYYTGAKPVLVDIERDSYNIDVKKLEAAITKKTKAIVPVHLYGQPGNLGDLLRCAKKHKLKVVEDACQAHGAEYKGKRVGTFGDAAAFSFYPGKNLGAFGDGGIIVTNNSRLKDMLLIYRDYGQKKKYQHLVKGYNARLDTLQAEILRVKLKHLVRWNELRRKHAQSYTKLFKKLNGALIVPQEMPWAKHVWHLYVIRTARRNALLQHLKDNRIFAGIHYPIPIHLQPAFFDLGYKRGSFPVTEKIAGEIVSLPMFPELSKKQIKYVVDKIKDFL